MNDRDGIDILLQHRVDVNASGYCYGTTLKCAALLGHLKLLQLLLGSNARVNMHEGQHGTAIRAALGRAREGCGYIAGTWR